MSKRRFFSAFQRFYRLPHPIRWTSYFVAGYGLYALILGLLIPLILSSILPQRLSDQLGRPVAIKTIQINPFILRLRMNDVSIAATDEQSKLFHLTQLDTELNFWLSLFTWTPQLAHLYLEGPDLNVVRLKTGQFNFSDIQQKLTQSKSTASSPDEKNIPQVKITVLRLRQGHIHYQDRPTSAVLDYQPISFTLNHFDTQGLLADNTDTLTNQFKLNVQGPSLQQLALHGTFQLTPLKLQSNLKLSQLQLSPLWPFIEKHIAAQLTRGSLDFSTKLQLNLVDQQPQLTTEQGALILENLKFSSQHAPIITLKQLAIQSIEANSQKQRLTAQSLSIEHPVIKAQLTPQGIDLLSLVDDSIQAPTDTTAPSTSSPTWHLQLGRLNLSQGEVELIDNRIAKGTYWQIASLSLSTGIIDSGKTVPLSYQLFTQLSSASGHLPKDVKGELASHGEYNLETQQLRATIDINKLQLMQFQPYLAPYVNLRLVSGQLSSHGILRDTPEAQISYEGDASIHQLQLDDLRQQPLLKWQDMQLHALQYQQHQQQLLIHQIVLAQPYARVLIDKQHHSNLGMLLKTSSTAKSKADSAVAQPKTTAEEPLHVAIDEIKLANGSAYFSDQSITPSFASGIESLHGVIRGLSSTPDTTATVDLQGSVDQYAPVTLKGKVNPLLKEPYLDLALQFKHVELVSINPYSGTYAGYYIDQGQLSLDLNYQLQKSRLKGQNHVVINQLKLGKASESKQAINLPLKLAIALLQDRHGVIDLGLQVQGDLDNPDFSYASIVWGAIRNVLTKAVMSPFSLIAKLVGSDETLDEVDFKPGQTVLTAKQKQKLDSLAKGLTDRPKLELTLKGGVNQVADTMALKEQHLQQQLLALSGLSQLPTPLSASQLPSTGPLINALEKLFEKQTQQRVDSVEKIVKKRWKEQHPEETLSPQGLNTRLHIALYNQLINRQNVPPMQLTRLAQRRAQNVKNYLVNQEHVDASRVYLRNSRNPIDSDHSIVHMALAAH